MASLPKRCLVVGACSVMLVRLVMACPMALIAAMVSSARPQRASATIGIKSMPADQQEERLEANLCWILTWSA